MPAPSPAAMIGGTARANDRRAGGAHGTMAAWRSASAWASHRLICVAWFHHES
jgi:hypothetical protein